MYSMAAAPGFPEPEFVDGMSDAERKKARKKLRMQIEDYLDRNREFAEYVESISRNQLKLPLEDVRENLSYDAGQVVAGLYVHVLRKTEGLPKEERPASNEVVSQMSWDIGISYADLRRMLGDRGLLNPPRERQAAQRPGRRAPRRPAEPNPIRNLEIDNTWE